MLLVKTHNLDFGIRKRTVTREIKLGPVSLQFITVVFLAILVLFYLAQSTQSATQGYKTREMEDQKNMLSQENEKLQIDAIKLQSLNEIRNNAQSYNLEQAKNAAYIPSSQSTTARR